MTDLGTVTGLYRYPVKSMQGESVPELDLTGRGVRGDRAYALLDTSSGRIASAHYPRRWGCLLHCQARWHDDSVLVTLPSGSTLPIGQPLETALSKLTGRPVRFITQAAEGSTYDFQVAEVPGHAPDEFIARILASPSHPGGRVGRLRVALDAPAGTLVDVAPVHILTTSSLAALRDSGGDPDIRRFRPNIVIDNGTEPWYCEAALDQLRLTAGQAAMDLTMPTSRCLLPTLEQAGLPRHKESLAAITHDNLLQVDSGNWACLGFYASVTAPGATRLQDLVTASMRTASRP